MDLIFSTEKFILNTQSYPGFPILISSDGRVVEEVLDFCISHFINRGRVKSRKSWITYGKTLYQFFGWCEVNNIDWRDVGNDREITIIAEYRDWNLSVEGGSLSIVTVNSRLRLICIFYRYAINRDWVAALPYAMEKVIVRRPINFLSHTDISKGESMVADVMLKTPRSIIKVLNKDQLKSFMKSISNITHKLIVRLALTTGMRREELATFPLKYVIDPTFYSSYRSFIRVDLKPQDMAIKGEHPRSIDIPRSVMEDLWQYSLNYRYQLEKKSGESHPTLFLTEYGKPYANQGAALLGIVKKAARSAGINYMNVHMLRHTYATHTLYAMKKTSEVSLALLYVRDRLGHASVTTTEKYLHCLSDAEDILMNDYQKEIDYISME